MSMSLNFFIGTEAELIKMFPVMIKLQEKQTSYRIIASGQNDIKGSLVLSMLNGGHVDLELSEENSIQKTAVGTFALVFSNQSASGEGFSGSFSWRRYRTLDHGCTWRHGFDDDGCNAGEKTWNACRTCGGGAEES